MASILIAVLVAFLSDGSVNYAAEDAKSIDACKATVARIAYERLAQNRTEDVKVIGFSYRCVEIPTDMFDFDIPPAPAAAPIKPKPELFPGDTQA